jgi:hypothetical protein
MNNAQISLQLYDTSVNSASTKEYIYSKVYPYDRAVEELDELVALISGNREFIRLEKKDGTLYIRSSDVRTLFLKPADPAYGS